MAAALLVVMALPRASRMREEAFEDSE
jgi:hypothetical protein